MSRLTKTTLTAFFALTLGCSYLLDGPSDIEVMQLVAQDAQVRVVLP